MYARTRSHALPGAASAQCCSCAGEAPSLLAAPSCRPCRGNAFPSLCGSEMHAALLFGARARVKPSGGGGGGRWKETGVFPRSPGCARLNLWGQQLRNNSWSLGCGPGAFLEAPSAPHLLPPQHPLLLEEEQQPSALGGGPAPAFPPHSSNHPPPVCTLRSIAFSPSDEDLGGGGGTSS